MSCFSRLGKYEFTIMFFWSVLSRQPRPLFRIERMLERRRSILSIIEMQTSGVNIGLKRSTTVPEGIARTVGQRRFLRFANRAGWQVKLWTSGLGTRKWCTGLVTRRWQGLRQQGPWLWGPVSRLSFAPAVSFRQTGKRGRSGLQPLGTLSKEGSRSPYLRSGVGLVPWPHLATTFIPPLPIGETRQFQCTSFQDHYIIYHTERVTVTS